MRAIGKFFFIVAVLVIQAACDGDGPGRDTTPPLITLSGANPQIIMVSEAYVEHGATATDNRDGDLTASIVIDASAVDSSVPGTYQVTYNVSDAAGNAAAMVTRTVIYEDRTPPVITLQGDNPQVIILGSPYVELGATATDNVDGDLTNDIAIDTSSVNLAAIGDYDVTYDVSDAAGNAAVTLIRVVTVNPPAPEQAQVTVVGAIKQLIFSWDEVTFTDFYRLLENPDGHSGFIQVGDDMPAGTLEATRDIAVHLFNWIDAQYQVEACNVTGCTTSGVVTATAVMLDTIGYFKASNTDAKDRFGWGVALSVDGRTLAVGARYESSAASGINGDQANNLAERAGAVYVFRFDGMSWQQHAYVKASNTDDHDGFGSDVALSGDGNTLVVGARWESSSATGVNGDQSDNSADSAGAVYVFRHNGAEWQQHAYIKPSNTDAFDSFGAAVDISEDGATMAVGAPMDLEADFGVGAVYLFGLEGDNWVERLIIEPPEANLFEGWFGKELALSAQGNLLAVLKPHDQSDNQNPAGGVYVYRKDGALWALDTFLESSNIEPGDRFGWGGIAFSADGTVLVAGAPGESSISSGINGDQSDNSADGAGAVYVFRYDGETWKQQAYIKASNPDPMDLFGTGVALGASGDLLVVEASHATYAFAFDGTEWRQISYVTAPYYGSHDVALSGDGAVLAVGNSGENSAATGIGGDQNDDSAPYAGAVYLY